MSIRGNSHFKKAQHLAVAGVFSFLVAAPVAAGAQTFVSGSAEVEETVVTTVPDEVLDNNVTRSGEDVVGASGDNTEVLAETAERGLAFTGSDVLGISLLGAGALGAGAAVLAARRRKHQQ